MPQWEFLLRRPTQEDDEDSELLTETALEQVNANRKFRDVAEFFNEITYLHLVPQLVRSRRRDRLEIGLKMTHLAKGSWNG